MSNKLISEMGLPASIANVFAARNILTAKAINTSAFLSSFTANPSFIRFLSPWTFRVSHAATAALFLFLRMLSRCRSSISWPFSAWISTRSGRPSRASARSPALPAERRYRSWRIVCDPHATSPPAFVVSMTHCAEEFRLALSRSWLVHQGSAKPRVKFAVTLIAIFWNYHARFCLKLALLAALPTCYGGLNGRIIYMDTESKFSSSRLIEIGKSSFPHIFQSEGMAQEMAGRIVVLRPSSLSEFTESLQQIKLMILQHDVKLLIVDSMAAILLGSLAEFSQIPIVVTNQVRSQNNDEVFHYSFQAQKNDSGKASERLESHLTAALGIQWAHAVTIRLIFEAHSGQRFIKVSKSPTSPAVAFPFVVESSGISLLSHDGLEVMGTEICTIHCQDDLKIGMALLCSMAPISQLLTFSAEGLTVFKD
ncbi:hypothetical protein C4D60_Mb08t21430 [Musa balbisiana]|uniref:Rad51-like C-terminal domain-containing protein n=1 Tax=Musa balbisiana TaxID=52838 RepID=A0A4S8K5H0_MUSBA|nr:hypothetical protein C4D60_Mb08t21430 [Musa balbisiana]